MKTNPVKQLLKTALLLAVVLFNSEGIAQCLSLSTTYTNCNCSGDGQGAASVSVTGGVGPYAYDWTGPYVDNSTSTSANFMNISEGTYTVVVYSSDGCMASTTVTIIALNSSPSINITETTCYNSTITLTASGASTYTWTTGVTTATITATYAGNPYVVTGTAANGCKGHSEISISEFNPTSVTVSASQTICTSSQTTATLIASNANTYLWSTGATTSSIVVNPSSTTVYTVTGTDACSNTTSVTTTVFTNSTSAAPSITISGNPTICPGTNSTFTASGGGTYTWTLNGSLIGGNSNAVGFALSAGESEVLNVTGTDASTGCVNTASLTVNDPGPSVSFPQNVDDLQQYICQGNTFTLNPSVSPSGYTYTWTPTLSGINPVVSPSVTTIYTLSVTYSVCTVSADFVLNVVPTPSVNLVSPLTLCSGITYTLSPTVTNTLTNTSDTHAEYSWSPATNLSSTTTETTIATVLNNASYTLTVSNIREYSGQIESKQILVCPQSATVSINSLPSPTVSISGNQIICPNQTSTLTASGANSYSWNSGATGSSIIVGTNGTGLLVPGGGSQVYSIVGTATNGCVGTASITVSDPLPSYTLNTNVDFPPTICSGSSYTINAQVGTETSYTWTPVLSAIDPVVSPTVTTLYVLTVSNGTCTESADFYVKVVPTPTISLTSPVYICSGTSYTLVPTTQGTYTHTLYNWNPPTYLSSVTTASTIASPTNTTSYSLTATNFYYPVRTLVGISYVNDTLFCKDTASTNVSIITNPPVPSINSISVCDSNYTTLYVPSPNSTYTYTWQGPCFNGIGDSIHVTTIGIYTVNIANSCGAVSTQTINVLVIGNIVAGFLTNLHYDEENTSIYFSNISLGTNLNYDWSFGNGDSSRVPNPYETFQNVGIFNVILFDSDSMHCRDTASATIIFSGNNSIVAIPNSFTPNNDHVDDVFSVNAVGISNFNCQISDRWGNLLYQWNGLSGFWNGIMPNGHVFMNGNYYYLLSYSDSNGNPQSRTGIVALKQ